MQKYLDSTGLSYLWGKIKSLFADVVYHESDDGNSGEASISSEVMSTFAIKWLKDKLGTKFFPITHIDAVKDDNGNNLDTLLNLKADDADFVRITNLEIDNLFLE